MAAPRRARQPLSIDDVAIDYSAVAPAATAAGAAASPASAAVAASGGPLAADARQTALTLLQHQQRGGQEGEFSSGQNAVSDVRAFDPGLQGVVRRYVNNASASAGVAPGGGGLAGRRRKALFGAAAPPHAAPSSHAAASLSSVPPPAITSVNTISIGGSGGGGGAASAVIGAPPSTPEAAQAAREFLATAQQHQQTSPAALQQRRAAYTAELRRFCQHNRRGHAAFGDASAAASGTAPSAASSSASAAQLSGFPDVGNVQTNSLLRQLFADGVPDMEPWDRWTSVMPRYADATTGMHFVVSPHAATTTQIHAAGLHLVHHPVIPDTAYTRDYQFIDLEQPVLPKEYKTKEELRAERRERLKEKQAKARQARAAATSAAGALMEGGANASNAASSRSGGNASQSAPSSAASRLLHDRLSTKNLALNLFASSVLNPLAADTKVLQQYELRDLEHQRRNHDRHVAALPDQILKRARDQRRHAAEAPLLRAYRIFPIYSAAHLGKLRHFANDNLLRGFILYVGDCDALVVLAGGEVAVRHLDRWILHKMEWEHPDTRAVRLCTVPLVDAETFSFHLKRATAAAAGAAAVAAAKKRFKAGDGRARRADGGGDAEALDDGKEPVFINMVPTVAEGEAFLRQLPAPPSPWSDLCAVWRTAFLADGLQV